MVILVALALQMAFEHKNNAVWIEVDAAGSLARLWRGMARTSPPVGPLATAGGMRRIGKRRRVRALLGALPMRATSTRRTRHSEVLAAPVSRHTR